MRILWSIPVRGETLSSNRGDMVRARHLIGALRADGHDVRVVQASEQAAGEFSVTTYRQLVRRLIPSRAALVLRDAGRWLHGRAHGRRVAEEARRHRADVIVETHVNFAVSGAIASRASGLPLILDDCSPSSEEIALGAGLPRLAALILKRQAEAASVIATSSQALRERLAAEGVSAQKSVVVPNGIEPAAFDDARREEVRARFGLNGRCVLGFVGSFQPWHRVDLLVETAAKLLPDHPLHLFLIGDGPGQAAALAAASRAGIADRITATGAVDSREVPPLLSAFDVGIVPGTNDYGHPMKLMDYGAAGLPSVAPDLPPVREVLQDGVNGLLFRQGDADGLSTAIARLAGDADLRRSMGARAREQVLAEASWSDRARSLVAAVQAKVVSANAVVAAGSAKPVPTR